MVIETKLINKFNLKIYKIKTFLFIDFTILKVLRMYFCQQAVLNQMSTWLKSLRPGVNSKAQIQQNSVTRL